MFIWLFVDIEFLVLVFNLISNWTIEEKFHIYGRPCIILYFNIYLVREVPILFARQRMHTYLVQTFINGHFNNVESLCIIILYWYGK